MPAGSSSASSEEKGLPKVIEIDIPDGVCIHPNTYGYGLFASKDFKTGQILYVTSCLLVPDLLGKLHILYIHVVIKISTHAQPCAIDHHIWSYSCSAIHAGKIILRTKTDGKEYELDMETHSVVQSDTGMRQLYTFDGNYTLFLLAAPPFRLEC